MALISKTRVLNNRGVGALGTYRDLSSFEYAAPPHLQHVIVPVEKYVGVKSELSPDCRSVFMHMSDPLKFLNGDASYVPHVTVDDITPKGKVLRGTGLHGPERTDVMRLVLFNRLKSRQLQRIVPSDREAQNDSYFFIASSWLFGSFILGSYLISTPREYAIKHEHFPWVPARTDGTRGPGVHTWFTN
ncbi:hypothetical protein BEWA_010060 [Theileria equi strain WA]|uniref:Uncharacterized protein n=1 Tax=Theileria equi strain WA TaxID=1537102 RepID=L0B151_THEEQ|nr:hypothetical protein BEWA_010060 [Theileria equi strain WA]AFZ81592.1 hypothetical protein BEWA_010060 [Theileria equi strain WA]|eukprot:XP_004831258.1 hypothetical protein BEWA_010060 [Theileria equi strain WA]